MKMPKPVKRPSGNWRIQIMVDGKRYSVTDPDPKVVKQKAKELYAGLQFEKRIPLTVGKAFDQYIDAKDSVLSPATIRGYKKIRKNYLQSLMKTNIIDLTQEDVQRAINADFKRGASSKSVRNAHGLLSAVLKEYRPNFILRTTLPQKKPYEIFILTEEELKKLYQTAEETKYYLPIVLASWLGLRMSEIRGLKFSDLVDGKIHIQRAIVEGENGPAEKLTKSLAGDRWIKCPTELQKLIEQQSHTTEYVVPLTEAAIYKGFKRLCDKAEVTPCRFHDLRHFAASEAHSLGVPDKYAMKRMGHKTDNMLKTVYQHTMADKEDSFSDIIDSHMESLFLDSKTAPEIAPEI
jgi:integrase